MNTDFDLLKYISASQIGNPVESPLIEVQPEEEPVPAPLRRPEPLPEVVPVPLEEPAKVDDSG